MDISFELIITTASKVDAFRQKYVLTSSPDPNLSVWSAIHPQDAQEILSIRGFAETFDRTEVAKACTSLLIKTYALTLDKQDPEVVELIRLRGHSLFARYSNTVAMETVDLLTSQKKFLPTIAELTECLSKVSLEQAILFKRAEIASKEIPSSNQEAPLKAVGGFAMSLRRELQEVMGMDSFNSWSHSMLDFRYLEKAQTVLVVSKSNFHAAHLRKFEDVIIKAAERLDFKIQHVIFRAFEEVTTNDPASPQFETSKFKKELYLMAEPWIRGSIDKIKAFKSNGTKAYGIVSVFDVCNTLTRFLEEKALLASQKINPFLQAFEFIVEGKEDFPKHFEEPSKKSVYGVPMTPKEYETFLALIERVKPNLDKSMTINRLVQEVSSQIRTTPIIQRVGA